MAVCDGPLLRAAGPPIGDPRRSGARHEPGLRHVAGRALYDGRSLAAGPDRVATAPAEAGCGRSCCSLVRDASPTSHQPAAATRGRPGTSLTAGPASPGPGSRSRRPGYCLVGTGHVF